MPTREERIYYSTQEINRIKQAACVLIPKFAEKIAPIYKMHNYKWSRIGGMIIPTMYDISDTCWILLDSILDRGATSSSTGRIEVRYQYGDIEFLFVPECETIYSHTIEGKG